MMGQYINIFFIVYLRCIRLGTESGCTAGRLGSVTDVWDLLPLLWLVLVLYSFLLALKNMEYETRKKQSIHYYLDVAPDFHVL